MINDKAIPLYQVKVNGKVYQTEQIRVSAIPFNRTWPGKQRDVSQSEIAYMVRIFDEESVNVEIESSVDFENVMVRPLSKKITPHTEGRKISFSIEKHGQYTIEFDGKHHALHLFYDPSRDFAEYGNATYSFGPGEHYPGLIHVKSGDRIYIDKDAIVHGSLFGMQVSDVRIYGHGVLNGGWEERTQKHGDIGWDNENNFSPEAVHTYGGIRFYSSDDIQIDGITVCDPASYAVSFFDSSNIVVKKTKVVGLWKYNNDGIDFFNCGNVWVNGCFVRSFDDSLCLKGITAFSGRNTENVIVEDCVFWCDWGKTCDIGLATACSEIQNIVFRNCDLIHNSGCCLAISNGQWAHIHDVTYENIHVEYSVDNQAMVYQQRDEQIYEPGEELQIPALISITDSRRNWQGNKAEDDPRCKITDVSYRNIKVIADPRITKKPKVSINRCMTCSDIRNITMNGVTVNGEVIREEMIQKVLDKKIIAIVRGVYGEDCVKLAQALYDGGIELMEVTFDQSRPGELSRTSDTIRQLAASLGDKMVFGAGTVTSVEMVEMAKHAGARFIVSPDTNEAVIRATTAMGMVSMPGAMTPTEVLQAHSCGADFVKIFPTSGLGASYLKAIRGPINHVRLLAVGGVNEKNVSEFLKAGADGVGVGGNLVNKEWIAKGEFNRITALAKEFVSQIP